MTLSFAVQYTVGFFKLIQFLTFIYTKQNASHTTQQFALLCIRKITIKNYSMTDATREVKGKSTYSKTCKF